jgi:hypothetical protein
MDTHTFSLCIDCSFVIFIGKKESSHRLQTDKQNTGRKQQANNPNTDFITSFSEKMEELFVLHARIRFAVHRLSHASQLTSEQMDA